MGHARKQENAHLQGFKIVNLAFLKRIVVLKTSLSSNAHTQPVLCMKMIGSTNAHDLVTLSSDGRLCSWSVDNLQQPIEAINLICPKTKKQVCHFSVL
jgi:hypothetical protein